MLRLGRVGLFVLAVALSGAACSGGPPPSFDPTGDCTTDGRAPGAYPDLEALVPTKYQGVAPGTLDSGRNCTVTNLGSLAKELYNAARQRGQNGQHFCSAVTILEAMAGIVAEGEVRKE